MLCILSDIVVKAIIMLNGEYLMGRKCKLNMQEICLKSNSEENLN